MTSMLVTEGRMAVMMLREKCDTIRTFCLT